MSLKKLSTEEMLEHSQRWLHARRDDLEGIEGTSGALALVERAHAALEQAARQGAPTADELHRLTMELGQLDLLHDRRVRGVYHILTGLGEALDDEALAQRYHDLRNDLLPAGVNTTLLNYREQAEAAATAADRLDADGKDLLRAVALPDDSTLLAQVEEWLATGRELGALWKKRQEVKDRSGAAGAPDIARARNHWIGAARVLRAALDAAQLPKDEREALGI